MTNPALPPWFTLMRANGKSRLTGISKQGWKSGQSLIVVGGRQRWWPTCAQAMARDLQKDRHQVIFAKLR